MKATKPSAVGEYSNSGEQRATRNTPAVTMVAAWISAETGVGPSIASGSQVCSRAAADLPIAPMNRRMQITRQRIEAHAEEHDLGVDELGALANTTSNSTRSNTR